MRQLNPELKRIKPSVDIINFWRAHSSTSMSRCIDSHCLGNYVSVHKMTAQRRNQRLHGQTGKGRGDSVSAVACRLSDTESL